MQLEPCTPAMSSATRHATPRASRALLELAPDTQRYSPRHHLNAPLRLLATRRGLRAKRVRSLRVQCESRAPSPGHHFVPATPPCHQPGGVPGPQCCKCALGRTDLSQTVPP